MKSINIQQTMEMIVAACDAIIANKPLLTEVDSRTGDGDHGIGMSNGMEKARTVLIEKAPFQDVNTVFQTTGMAMLNSMGGASGVIFGSMFLGGIGDMEKITELNGDAFVSIFSKALDVIKERGKAQTGDKTMVDALEPAVTAMREADKADLAALAALGARAAEQGVENTKLYVARFGKAQYLGDRTIGLQDAGATSVSIIFNAMHQYLKKLEMQP